MPRAPRFLVLRGGAIGDFVVTLPALRALRERWPDAHIELVGYPHIARLALAGGLVQAVHSLDRAGIAQLFAPGARLEAALRDFIRSFDLVLTYLHDPDGVVRGNLLSTGVRQVLYRSPVAPAAHAVDHLLQPLETLAIYEAGARPSLEPGAAEGAAGRRWREEHGLEPLAAAVHPGSGSPAKNWPLPRFLALARGLAAAGLRPFFLLGEADAALAPAVRAAAAGWAPVLEGLELAELAGVLCGCALYVGNDSGVTHLAAALGVPTVALFGPSDPAAWGPRGARVRILAAPAGALEALETESVLEAARAWAARASPLAGLRAH